jgi:hypothetical protein
MRRLTRGEWGHRIVCEEGNTTCRATRNYAFVMECYIIYSSTTYSTDDEHQDVQLTWICFDQRSHRHSECNEKLGNMSVANSANARILQSRTSAFPNAFANAVHVHPETMNEHKRLPICFFRRDRCRLSSTGYLSYTL